MLEPVGLGFVGLLAIAGASHRLRGEAGGPGERARRLMRAAGWALLIAAYFATPGALPGERAVRFLGGVSLAGIALVLLLSARPRAVLAPVRWVVGRRETGVVRR